jgi:L-rhamnose isomerase/sugar isomerase
MCLWDLPNGVADVPKIQELEKKTGIRPGSINPNVFQEPGVQVWLNL